MPLPAIIAGIASAISAAQGAKNLIQGDPEAPIGPSQPSAPPEYTFLRALLQPQPDPFGMGGQGVPFGVPGFQFGTFDQPGGPAMVGEAGPELAYLEPQTPVIPMPDFQPVEEPAASALPHQGFMSELARALGPDPFSRQGSLGPVLEIALQAARGRQRRPNTGAQLGVAGLGSIANILSNRELVKQSDVEELNKALRERSQARNKAMLEQQAEIAKEKRGEARTIAAEQRAENKAEGRKFQISPTLAGTLGLPADRRVTFDEFRDAVKLAQDMLPKNEFDLKMRGAPAEWRDFLKKTGEIEATKQPSLGRIEAEAAARARGTKAGAPPGQELKPPSATEREQLTQHLNVVRQTGRIRELFKKEFVGPAAGPSGALAGAGVEIPLLGVKRKPGQATFRASLALYNNAARKVLAGSAQSKQELKNIEKQLPGENDPSDVFLAKLEETDRRVREEAQKYRNTLTSTGIDLSRLEPIPAAGGGGLVTMRAPDGGLLRVPAEKVAELEAQGARRQ